jgi:hypothetical protein
LKRGWGLLRLVQGPVMVVLLPLPLLLLLPTASALEMTCASP